MECGRRPIVIQNKAMTFPFKKGQTFTKGGATAQSVNPQTHVHGIGVWRGPKNWIFTRKVRQGSIHKQPFLEPIVEKRLHEYTWLVNHYLEASKKKYREKIKVETH
jgi:hypothetical protein